MKVYIKNKVFTLTGSSYVNNENGAQIYEVKGKFLSPTRKKKIYDMKGNLLYIVRNKFWTWFSRYALIYDANKNLLAKVKHGYFAVKKYTVLGYKDELTIDGRFFSLESQIRKNGETCATIRRNIDLFRDSFELESSEEDMPFMTALVIAIDNITDDKQKK